MIFPNFISPGISRTIDPAQCEHKSPYCLKLKREYSKNKLRQCIYEYQKKEFRPALEKRAPFIIYCHAGAMELAVPIFIRKKFIGVLCAGTFRAPEASGYRDYEEERNKLPVITEKRLLKLGDLIVHLAEHHLGAWICLWIILFIRG